MAQTKTERTKKKQLGQFMTPLETCREILSHETFLVSDRVLEPSFGCGNFIICLIEKFLPLYEGNTEEKLDLILRDNIWGVELDPEMHQACLDAIQSEYGYLPEKHNLFLGDFLLWESPAAFTRVIGNPPFGGTIQPAFQNLLERKYGTRSGYKIKKETYSFFMIKSLETLAERGSLMFICSDTFLTIKTMKGLRKFLFSSGFNRVSKMGYFSEETSYPMITIRHFKSDARDYIELDGRRIPESSMSLTDNFSWSMQDRYGEYFKGAKIGDYLVGSGGMTIGKNELFLREIEKDGSISEEYDFEFFEDPITLENETARAKNNQLSPAKQADIKRLERIGAYKRNICIKKKESPEKIQIPNEDYCLYNKPSSETVYAEPKTAIYWKDDGDACYAFKKNGNWYLHGVGGKPFFKKEAITWQLISSSIKARYLPEGYILDNGSPIAAARPGIARDELFFILGWLLTEKCSELLKNVINHTKNIQSKDIERLPYPWWVSAEKKKEITEIVKAAVECKMRGEKRADISDLNTMFEI